MGTSPELSSEAKATPYILTLQMGNGSHALGQEHWPPCLGYVTPALQDSVLSDTQAVERHLRPYLSQECSL